MPFHAVCKNIRRSGAAPNFCHEKVYPDGSLTVECALVLPVFLMAVLTLLSFMYAVRLETDRTLSLSNRSRKAAAAAFMGQDEELYIDIPEVVTCRFPFAALPVPDLKIAVRTRVKTFSGYSAGSDPAGDASGGTFYLSENADVYHTHADCTHLDLTIFRTTLADVGGLRNSKGERYHPCRGFPAGWTGPVYVSKMGNYYYPSMNYGSLTRHVHTASAEECSGLPLCERCAERDAVADAA